jgi:hypothetical protein
VNNYSAILKQPPIQLALAGVILIGFVYLLIRKTASDAASAVGLDTRGTAYEGTGPVGIVANIANKASGGTLEALGTKISQWIYPDPGAGDSITYIATFPDGQRHAIVPSSVDAQGFFTRNGTRYRLAWNSELPRKRIAIAA